MLQVNFLITCFLQVTCLGCLLESTGSTQQTRRLHMSAISIIGTGGMDAAIGGLAAKAGHTVEVMSRGPAKARALAGQLGASATTGTFGAARAWDFVILAVLRPRTRQGRTPRRVFSRPTMRRQRRVSRLSSKVLICVRSLSAVCKWPRRSKHLA